MQKRELWLTLVSVAVALSIFGVATADAQCNVNCVPSMKPGWPRPAYTVYLDPSLNATERNAAMSGMNMWNSWFSQNGEGTPFYVLTSPQGANIIVKSDPSMHNSYIGAAAGGGFITVNPDYSGESSGYWTQIMGHEFGHDVGYMDVYGNCNGQTIMYGNITSGNYSYTYLTHLTGTDDCALDSDYPPPQQPPPVNGGIGTYDTTCDGTMGTGYCGANSPIILNLGGGAYELSGADDPVRFDIDANGQPNTISWTARGTRMAFLALDRNGNGTIDDGSELFGNHTFYSWGGSSHPSNGFDALASYDSNNDGVIDASDPIWSKLLLWIDWNHDGVSQPNELIPISSTDITALYLNYHWTGRRDQFGNTFRYECTYKSGGQRKAYYDIYFVEKP